MVHFLFLFVIIIPQARRVCAFLDEEYKTEGRISIKVVSMETFTSEEAKPLIQLHCCSVGDFGLQSNLDLLSSILANESGKPTHLVSVALDHNVDCHADKFGCDALATMLLLHR